MSDFEKRRVVGSRRPAPGPLDLIDLSAPHRDDPDVSPAWDERPDFALPVPAELQDDTCPWNVGFYDWGGELAKIVDWQEVERGLKSRTASTGYIESKRLTALQATFRDLGDCRKLASVIVAQSSG